jgi:predicted dinucleotide-binding enzyme
MRIAIIGTGNVGTTLGAAWVSRAFAPETLWWSVIKKLVLR